MSRIINLYIFQKRLSLTGDRTFFLKKNIIHSILQTEDVKKSVHTILCGKMTQSEPQLLNNWAQLGVHY